jgi:RimJ/RimL family protein N-acetyltransferase
MPTRPTTGSATEPVLTARLVLTPVGPEDVGDLVHLYNDPQVAFWTGPWTDAAVEVWATQMAARWAAEGVGKWMARDRWDGSLVGRGGFTRFDLDGEAVLELGWVVRDARTGRGYATEIGRAALAWAAEHEPRLPIVAFTEVHNRASRAVMERLGLRPAGTIRREGLVEGLTGVQPEAPFALYRYRSVVHRRNDDVHDDVGGEVSQHGGQQAPLPVQPAEHESTDPVEQ